MTLPTLEFGSISVTPILDSAIRVPGDLLFSAGAQHFAVLDGSRGLVPEDWEKHPEHVDPEGLFHMHFGGYLIRGIGDRVILVDLGVGPKPFAPPGIPVPYDGVLLESLRAEGVEPGDVTDVLLTHLHMDHIGWASLDGAPVFSEATYRCAVQDWSAMSRINPPTEELLSPVEDRLETWDGDSTLFPGLDLRVMPGHTPGSTAIVVSSGDDRAFLVGDIAHCPHEFMYRDWAGLGDADAVQASQARQDLADELARTGAWAGSTHFAGLGIGQLSGEPGARTFDVGVQRLDDLERAGR